MTQIPVPIPPALAKTFRVGIVHPDLWLWDSWCLSDADGLHLYMLGLARQRADGTPIQPADRNAHPFHFRYFHSQDEGQSWMDRGSVLEPAKDAASYYARNVWSGSITALPDGRRLMGLTGLREMGADQPFLQSIGFALMQNHQAEIVPKPEPLSCPLRDYDAIRAAGYYLDTKETLGHKSGEAGGPILAWRDPFVFIAPDGTLHCVWSAKVSPTEGAIAHAELSIEGDQVKLEKLHPPIRLPDGNTITQAEVPKIYHDAERGDYWMLVSACDRLSETQPASEVTKTLRLYRADDLRGPWRGYEGARTILPNLPNMFGASVSNFNFAAGQMELIAPITEAAMDALQLTLGPVQKFNLASHRKTAE